jgi:hypothetical protein
MKIIKIKDCTKCPYFNIDRWIYDYENHDDLAMICNYSDSKIIKNLGRYSDEKLVNANIKLEEVKIPKWCPLEDRKDD